MHDLRGQLDSRQAVLGGNFGQGAVFHRIYERFQLRPQWDE